MESFLSFFENMPVWQRGAWVFVCLVFCWILEGSFPLFRFGYNKVKHVGVNMVFLSTTMLINALISCAVFFPIFKLIFRREVETDPVPTSKETARLAT